MSVPNKLTILIVDDDQGILTVWSRLLQSLNAEIRTARNVEEALDQMRRLPPPDLVILDLNIPPLSAGNTAKVIVRFREINPSVAVVAVSGMEKEEMIKALAGVAVESVQNKRDIGSQVGLLKVVRETLDTKKRTSGQILQDMGDLIQKTQ